ncbi:MAG: choline dehydrogenase [Alphaproteobacteria bacterium]
MEAFDYIIVGAGSAGCVLANKLSADPAKTVLLLEAGPMDRDLMIHMPAGVYKAYLDPRINWSYKSEDEPHLFDRNVDMPRGKVVGGSSSINSMVYMRGHPMDYDRWESELGLKGWSYADCLPYFKACETSDRGGDTWRGNQGPLGVTKGSYDNPLYDAFLQAGDQAGQGRSEDLNGFQPEGVSRFDATRWNGKRCSAAVAFLKPVLNRPNLKLITRAHVEKLTTEGKAVTGLVFGHKNKRAEVKARKEVILAGGAINSPQVLMLSGIGPADHLTQQGIKVVHDLQGVGQNLQDHATVILQWSCKKNLPIHTVDKPWNKLAAGLKWIFTRKGVVSSNVWEAGGLIRGNAKVAYPNIQYHFAPVGFEFEGEKIKLRQAFAIHVDLLRPRSSGEVRLQSSDPYQKPTLLFSYFENEQDLEELVEGVRKTRELINQPAMDEYRDLEFEPGSQLETDEDLKNWVRMNSETDYHPSCTCAMGRGEKAVVDGEMRVHGIENLRVVDASVMPNIVSGNLNAPTMMIAARAADFILGEPQKEPEHATFSFQNNS